MTLPLSKIQNRPVEDLLFLGYNQTNICLSSGVANGFRIYNCDPQKQTFQRGM